MKCKNPIPKATRDAARTKKRVEKASEMSPRELDRLIKDAQQRVKDEEQRVKEAHQRVKDAARRREPADEKWELLIHLMDHDLKVGADPAIFIDLIQSHLDCADDPERRKLIEDCLARTRQLAERYAQNKNPDTTTR